jgi:hypothetical protein
MKTGQRFKTVELSTIDTALLAAGVLSCQSYFDRGDPVETKIRADADRLYRSIEWDWAQPRPPGIAMGWTPEEGYHSWNWHGYDESMILFILALGSPTHPVAPAAWEDFVATYRWGEFLGQTYVNFSPLFGYQYSHVWIDFRGIQDRAMREKGIDYSKTPGARRTPTAPTPWRTRAAGPATAPMSGADGVRRAGGRDNDHRWPVPHVSHLLAAGRLSPPRQRRRHARADGRRGLDPFRPGDIHPGAQGDAAALGGKNLQPLRLRGRLQPDAV